MKILTLICAIGLTIGVTYSQSVKQTTEQLDEWTKGGTNSSIRIESILLPNGQTELKITGSKEDLEAMLFGDPAVDASAIKEAVTNSIVDLMAQESSPSKAKRGSATSASVSPVPSLKLLSKLKLPDISLNKLFPMKNYCVTYTTRTDRNPEEGTDKKRETIHVRGGMDLARLRAKMDHGHDNVVSVKRGGCGN